MSSLPTTPGEIANYLANRYSIGEIEPELRAELAAAEARGRAAAFAEAIAATLHHIGDSASIPATAARNAVADRIRALASPGPGSTT